MKPPCNHKDDYGWAVTDEICWFCRAKVKTYPTFYLVREFDCDGHISGTDHLFSTIDEASKFKKKLKRRHILSFIEEIVLDEKVK
jgi:hypothetical protein